MIPFYVLPILFVVVVVVFGARQSNAREAALMSGSLFFFGSVFIAGIFAAFAAVFGTTGPPNMSLKPPEHRVVEFVLTAFLTALPIAALGSIAYFVKRGLFGNGNRVEQSVNDERPKTPELVNGLKVVGEGTYRGRKWRRLENGVLEGQLLGGRYKEFSSLEEFGEYIS